MKKVTFVILSLIFSATAFGQDNVATADVDAVVVEAIKISSTGALNFGSFTAPAAGTEYVTVSPDGSSRTFTDTDMEITSLSAFGVPTFTVTRDNTIAYNVAIAINKQPTETGGATMTLSNLTSSVGISAVSSNTFTIGGKLAVAAGQTAGAYDGIIEVTVTYN